MNHKMNLYARPFAMIASGQKTIELRLNDEKRSKISVGDKIEFENSASGEKLLCMVVMLYRYNSFSELYKELPLLKCGYTSDDVATAKPEDMDLYYSPERQKQYGVLGIEIKLV